jgi:streptogramin lyase
MNGQHPFFVAQPDARPGDWASLLTNGEVPRSLSVGAGGTLFWASEGSRLNALFPRHGRFQETLPDETFLRTLTTDPQGNLWYFGDRTWAVQSRDTLKPWGTGTPYAYRLMAERDSWTSAQYDKPGCAGPHWLVSGAPGILWGASPEAVFYFSQSPQAFAMFPNPYGAGPVAMAWDAGREVLWLACPEQDTLYLTHPSKLPIPVPCQPGSRPRGIAVNSDGTVWFTCSGTDEVARFKPQFGGKPAPIRRLKLMDKAPATLVPGPDGFACASVLDHRIHEPHGIAQGPDGNMWVTLKAANEVACFTPDGELLASFALPEGMTAPTDIIPFGDDRMLVTLENQARILAITTFPKRDGKDADSKASGATDRQDRLTKARAAALATRLNREERALARAERMRKSDERYRAREAREKELAKLVSASSPAQGPVLVSASSAPLGAVESKQTSALSADAKNQSVSGIPEGDTADEAFPTADEHPWNRLADRNFYVSRRAVRHILRRHTGGEAGAGVFHADFRSRDALYELMAWGLERARFIGKESDIGGRYRTIIPCPGAGVDIDGYPADHVEVISEGTPHPDLGMLEHDVITAFPVVPSRRRI